MARNVSRCFLLLSCAALLGVLTGCQELTYGDNDLHIVKGTLHKGDEAVGLVAFDASDLVTKGCPVDLVAPALVNAAEVGGNAIAVDLPPLTPESEQLLRDLVERAKNQHLRVLVRVLGELTEPEAAMKQVEQAAQTFANDLRPLYVLDDAATPEMVARFKELAPKTVVAAATGGDLTLCDSTEGLEGPALVRGVVAKPDESGVLHYLLAPTAENRAALDKLMRRRVEDEPWTPDNSVLDPAEREEGFIALFDGKTMNGWGYEDDTDTGSFSVTEAGELATDGSSGPPLYTRDRYDDYILRLEFKIVAEGNSGIFNRAPRACRQSKTGFEFQVLGDYGQEVTETSTGSVYDMLAPAVNASKPAGEWNEVEIVLQGGHLKATLNGEVVQDTNFDDHEELKHRLRRGFIGLQDHDHPAAFRNIRLKQL